MSGYGRRAWGWHPLSPLICAGARVLAVELHPGRADGLRRRFRDEPVTVIQTDASDLRLPTRPFRVVASPPYGISTALLERLLAPGSRLVAADLVLQRAVVNRYVAGRANGSERWLRRYGAYVGLRLPRKAFRPAPKVDSAVLVLRRT